VRVLLYIHLVAVAFWLGSQLFLVAVVLPALRGDDAEAREATMRKVGMTYGKVAAPVLFVILVTGMAMAAKLDLTPSDSSALKWKLVAVAVVVAATIAHSVASVQRRRRLARVSSVVALVATLVAVWFATGL
jgi:putative copper export protein